MLSKLKRFWLLLLAVPVLLFGTVFYTNVPALRVNGGQLNLPAVFNDLGGYIFYNTYGAGGGGNTTFVNLHNGGSGGWNGYDIAPGATSLGTAKWSISSSGLGTFNGLSANNGSLVAGYSFMNGTGLPSSGLVQGAYTSWNLAGGYGETDFIDQYGGGVGGFNFYNSGGTSPGSLLARLDNTGTLTLNGATVGTENVTTSTIGTATVTGSINLNGPLVGLTQAVEHSGSCTTGTGGNNTCSFVVSWGQAFQNANYKAVCTGIGPSNSAVGQPNLVGIQSKSTTGVTVLITNGQNSGAVAASFAAVDCVGTP